ncbi:hypothetical protein C0Q70_04918 [Pomacea canaliculata]|uniref:XPG N-terminal domain-containing protein n=1 Tax=Pomacea canaliculata TaxID=400727 RepID=A0A2T7PJS2_POMCA|nr:hypothetical protein C0Q70_04918 [Pomacea canaliculata]
MALAGTIETQQDKPKGKKKKMGVTGLWSVLEPVKHRISLKDLQGQTLAVDLSIWVCENQSVRQMQHKVKKPHLRNLFFRVWSLLKLGVRLVFIIEGEAPLLKQQEMKKRLQNRNPASQKASSSHKCSRSSFQILLKECCQLLNALGVPYIQSQGEAERLCAALSAAGIVDGCISDDSDCFLYGARKVYKDLSTDARPPPPTPQVSHFFTSLGENLVNICVTKPEDSQCSSCLRELNSGVMNPGLVNESGQLLQLVTIEEQILFEKVFPDMVSQFLQPAEKSKSKKKHESLEHQTSPQSKAEKEEAETAPLSQRLMSKLSKTDSSVQSHTASPAASLPQLDALCADRCSYMSDGQFDLQFSFTLTDCSLVAPNHLNLTTQSSSLFDSPIPEKNQAVDLDSSHISIFSSEESVWEKEVISTCSQKSATQHVFYPASANDSFCKRQEKLSGFDSPKHEFPPCKPIHILHSDDLCVSASATNNSTTSMPNSLGKEKTQNNTPMIVEEPRKKPEHCDEHLPLFQRLRQRLPKETQNELAKLTSFENLDTKAFHF